MFQEINERLAAKKVELRQKLHREHNSKKLREQHEQEVIKLQTLHKKLQSEQQDVDKLMGMSFGAFFYSLIGKKDEKLSKEKEELLQAKIKYEAVLATVKDLEEEMATTKEQLSRMSDVESEYADLLLQKERLIQAKRPDLVRVLREYSEQQSQLEASQKELDEALEAGRATIQHLDKAIDKLKSASSWGAWDMLGGGAVSTYIKHSRINEARDAVHEAQKSLRRFERELYDVQRESRIQIDIGEMLTFADFFFDNIITDWIVQDRISTSLQQAKDKMEKVIKLQDELLVERKVVETELGDIRHKSLDLIEYA
ncbi:hypothetical protein BRE01_33230 [Brevibacillus reuszeri]|uniref:Uncharacterized protein n=1 Tax=Brevibacillus reuszeri TaxID=54915 RepID=A0A0K9YY27_9BACL|nr:hypothetical protein [Brevibacillus reuszeri]KNB73561.1 hypothetical protein ADS79_06345 [Brevibacillus reuszeri]MED1858641.1 hypothetical protein [Brevibacillus reuszeri]GED69621.1 hypothetical protein BRE01_33230 [Brevibacillus reuszeri]